MGLTQVCLFFPFGAGSQKHAGGTNGDFSLAAWWRGRLFLFLPV
jgi:hypothetical protein